MPVPVYMRTLGCPKNRVDSEVMLGTLTEAGYRLVGDWLRKESPGGVGETEGESLSASQVFERWGYEALEAVEQLAAFDVTAPRRG